MLETLDWRIFALASAFFAALTAIFGKLGVAGMNSNLATVIRTVVILFITAAIVTFRKEWQAPKDWELRGVSFLLLSGVATGLSWLFYYRALQMAPASKVAPVDKSSVAFALLLAWLFLGEALGWKAILGVLLILSGTVLVLL